MIHNPPLNLPIIRRAFQRKSLRVVTGVRMCVKCSLLLAGGRSAGVRHQEAVKASNNLSIRQQPLKQAATSFQTISQTLGPCSPASWRGLLSFVKHVYILISESTYSYVSTFQILVQVSMRGLPICQT